MTTLAPGLGAVTRRAMTRMTALVLAAALALASISATASPARSDTTEDLLRFLFGVATVAIIVSAIDDSRAPPRHLGRWVLPDACMETVRARGRHIDVYNARCLERAGLRNLPRGCESSIRTDRGNRRSYLAQCLYEAGYRAQSWSDRPSRPPFHPPVHPQPPVFPPHPGVRPQPQPGIWLPDHCAMTYRQSGRSVDGYDGRCLTNAGYWDLPRQCRVSDAAGNHYFNADCLARSGYRTRRY